MDQNSNILNKKLEVVASIQFDPTLLDVNKNLSVAKQLTFEAITKGAKIIVLPELCTSGYVLYNKDDAYKCAQERNGYQTIIFSKIAAKFKCWIIFGYIELLDGELYNSAAIIGPNGLAGNIQKHNLWGPDHMWATPSVEQHNVIVTPYGRLGVLICRDVMNQYRASYKFYKQNEKFYKKGSVDIIALLTNWGSNYGYPDTAWVDLAEYTESNVIVSNRIGKELDLKFKGGSCIIDKNRKIWTNGSSFTDNAIVGGYIVV